MKGALTRFLVVGVPGLCFVIVGVLSQEYAGAALGGILVIDAVYMLSRKRAVGNSDKGHQRRSFVFAGIIGTSFVIAGLAGYHYLLVAAGTVLLVGSLVRLYHATLHEGS